MLQEKYSYNFFECFLWYKNYVSKYIQEICVSNIDWLSYRKQETM